MCIRDSLEGDVAPVDVVGYFRLQEMAVEVYPHEKGAEISYLVIVLHFVDGHSVDAELGLSLIHI